MQGDPGNERSQVERPGWVDTLRDPAVLAILLYTGIAIVAAAAAYFTLFSQFLPADDEGTVLVSLKAFANGETLYRDVYTPYGPFFFEFFGGLFALTGLDVTTDASRSIVVVVWVLASFCFGLGAQWITARLLLGGLGMVVAFGALGVLANEPMHPHGLAILLIAAIVLLAIRGPGRRLLWSGIGFGVLLAALVLTKFNLGAFAVVATLLAAALTVEPFCSRRWLRYLAAAGFLVLPLVVMERDLGVSLVRELVAIASFCSLALLIAAWGLRDGPREGDRAQLRWLLAAAGGFAAAFLVILVAIVLTGPSLGDVYDGVVTEAVRVRDVLLLPLGFPNAALDWAIAAAAAAAIAVRLRGNATDRSALWTGLLRIVAGIAIWFAVAHVVVIGLNPSAENSIVLPLALVWIAAIPPLGARESTSKRFLRVLLPALAIAEALQVYPVAGSQAGIASVTFVPVGALCLADGLADLKTWAQVSAGASRVRALGFVVLVVSAAALLQVAAHTIVRPGAASYALYRDNPALDLPGASQLHLPAEQAAAYEQIVDLIHAQGCTSFIGYANVNSLYLWSGIEAPPPVAPGAWIEALDEERQQQGVESLRAAERPCAVRSGTRAEAWLGGEEPPDLPLVRYLLDDFEGVATVGEFELAVPKQGSSGP